MMRSSILNFIAFILVILSILATNSSHSSYFPEGYGLYFIYGSLVVLLMLQLDSLLSIKGKVQLSKLSSNQTKLENELIQIQSRLHDEKKQITELKTHISKISLEKESLHKKYTSQIKEQNHKINELLKNLEESNSQSSKIPSAVQLLSVLQKQGRLIDFLMEDIGEVEDEQVASAARVVHSGCQDVLHKYFSILPIRNESEGQGLQVFEEEVDKSIELQGDCDPKQKSTAILLHKGWKNENVQLPTLTKEKQKLLIDNQILYPAQAEIRTH